MRFNTEFTAGIVVKLAPTATHQRLTMRAHRSLKINATGQNRAELATWWIERRFLFTKPMRFWF